MKKVYALIWITAVSAAGLSTWKEYTVNIPNGFTNLYAVAVNAVGTGYAFAGDGHDPGKQYFLKLNGGVWTPAVAPPVHVYDPSVSADGTLYAVDNRGSGVVYRFEGSYWKTVALPERFALRTFNRVTAVGPREFWAEGTTAAGFEVVVYFQNDQPYRIFNLGQLIHPNGTATASLAVPRLAAPGGDCYVAVQASNNPFNNHRWMLFILRTDGGMSPYPFPLDGYACDGLSAYQAGNVKIMLTANSLAESRLYTFAAGVFRETVTFTERVRLESYPTPTDGWGYNTSGDKIYHWTGGAVTPAVAVNGDIRALDMVSGTEGWAVGSRLVNGERKPAMWHYSDVEPTIVPTSLGRVKAAFK